MNNLVQYVGEGYEGSIGIAAGYPRDILIANNTVCHTPYSAISVGYGWTSQDNPMSNNRILNNEVYNAYEVQCDAGAVYTLSKQIDSECAGNYLHDNTPNTWGPYGYSGLYFDENTEGYVIHDNVIVRTGEDNPERWVSYNGTKDKNIEYNTYFEEDSPEAKAIIENAGVQEDFDESVFTLPTVSAASYDSYENSLTISGSNFGEELGTVYVTGSNGYEAVPSENISSWTKSQIIVEKPDSMQSGSIYVITNEGQETNKDVIVTISYYVFADGFSDDFEGYVVGDWDVSGLSNSWRLMDDNSRNLIELVQDGDNQVIKITSDGSNRGAYPILNESADKLTNRFGDHVITYDFKFPEELGDGGEGIYFNVYRKDDGQKLAVAICPWMPSRTIGLEVPGVIGNPAAVTKSFNKTDTWYTLKEMISDNRLYIKVWEKESAEPDNWDVAYDLPFNSSDDCACEIEFYANNKAVLIDNINIQLWAAVADKTALQSLYDTYENVENEDYTSESWDSFEKALADAKAALDNADASVDEVNTSSSALQDAYNRLKKNESSHSQDGATEAPDTDNDESNASDGGKAPVIPVLIAILALIAVCAIAVLIFRQRKRG